MTINSHYSTFARSFCSYPGSFPIRMEGNTEEEEGRDELPSKKIRRKRWMIYQKIGLSRRGRVTRSIKRSSSIQNGSVWSPMMEYTVVEKIGGRKKRAWVMWDCRDPSRNRNAESMGLRLVREYFSLSFRVEISIFLSHEYELRKSARTDQQKGETNEKSLDKMIFLLIFVDLYININIYIHSNRC